METLQPKLRFPGFNDNWEEIKLENFSKSISSGKSKARETDGDFCLYGSTGIIGYTNENDYSGKCILVARVGANAGNLYKVDGEYSVTDNTLMLFTNENNYFDFTYYLLINAELNKLVFGSGQPLITGGQLKNLDLFVPKIQEQTKIANFLSAVDEKLKLLIEKKSLLEDYKKGIMQKIFNQEIRFKDNNDNDFEDWQIKSLGDIGLVLNGLTYSPDDISEDGVLVLRSSNIKDNRLKFDDNVFVNKDNFTAVIENDILICVRNGSRNLIGKNTLITKEIEGVAFGAFMSVYRSNFNRFLIHWFGSSAFFENVNLNLGATINSINGSDLRKFKIPFPSLDEQNKIANFLSVIDEKIVLVSNQIQDTQEYKKGLLQQMFV